MLKLLSKVLGLLSGDSAKSIAGQIRQARKDALDATNNEKRLEKEAEIERLLIRLEAQKGSVIPRLARLILFAAPIGIYLWKIVVWDRVLGYGVTDALGAFERDVATAVLGFYFLIALREK